MIAPCERCLTPCEVRGPSPRMAHTQVVLVASGDDRGLCASCAVQWWLHTVDGIRWALQSSGPDMLTMPALQQMLAPLLAQMHPDLGTVDWARMRANWDLSWPLDWELPGDHCG